MGSDGLGLQPAREPQRIYFDVKGQSGYEDPLRFSSLAEYKCISLVGWWWRGKGFCFTLALCSGLGPLSAEPEVRTWGPVAGSQECELGVGISRYKVSEFLSSWSP